MKLNESEIENIKQTVEGVAFRIIIKNNSYNEDEINLLIRNPITYLRECGLNESVRKIIVQNKKIYSAFLRATRRFLNLILEKTLKFITDCFLCIYGLLFILAIIFEGASFEWHELHHLKDIIINQLSIFFMGSIIALAIIEQFLKWIEELGFPHIQIHGFAHYLCSQQGACSDKK